MRERGGRRLKTEDLEYCVCVCVLYAVLLCAVLCCVRFLINVASFLYSFISHRVPLLHLLPVPPLLQVMRQEWSNSIAESHGAIWSQMGDLLHEERGSVLTRKILADQDLAQYV